MGRRSARKNSFILIYQFEYHTCINIDEFVQDYFLQELDLDDYDKSFIFSEVFGTFDKLTEIDKIISNFCVNHTIDRLNKVDLAILRLAIYEIKFFEDIPHTVSINEAIELAKIYGSDESPNFINGLLGKV